MPGKPSHFQDYRVIGEVKDLIVKHGRLSWIVIEVDQSEPCRLPVDPGQLPAPPDLARGDLVEVRGELRLEFGPGWRHGQPYVLATKVLERVRRGRPPTASVGVSRISTPDREED
jgi:hypothetical protein